LATWLAGKRRPTCQIPWCMHPVYFRFRRAITSSAKVTNRAPSSRDISRKPLLFGWAAKFLNSRSSFKIFAGRCPMTPAFWRARITYRGASPGRTETPRLLAKARKASSTSTHFVTTAAEGEISNSRAKRSPVSCKRNHCLYRQPVQTLTSAPVLPSRFLEHRQPHLADHGRGGGALDGASGSNVVQLPGLTT